jgi:hypothetical protein
MGGRSKRTLYLAEIAIRREAAKRAKKGEPCMDKLSKKDTEDVVEEIQDSSSKRNLI